MKLCWFRNIEQDFPLWDTSVHKISSDKYLTSLNKECQRYEKGHIEIQEMKIKDAKYLIRFQIWIGTMYVVKKKTKGK